MEAQEDLQVDLSTESLLEMYWLIVLSRRLDERTWVLHRQGKIAFHISGIGHEAAQVGAALALRRGQDWVVPYYRDLALMLALGFTPKEFMLGVMGKKGEPSSGARQMPSHWSLKRMNVVSHSSPVATQAPHASGIGFAIKMRGDDVVVLTSIGEGSTSQGEWYEAVNWAAVHQLPVVFMVENNLYAISVRQERQMAVEHVADKAAGLGLPGVTVDGLDALAVHQVMTEAVDRARSGGGPTVVETMVQRMTPHSSDDDDRSYRTREELEALKAQDPLDLHRDKLLAAGILTEEAEREVQARAKREVDEAVAFATEAPYPDISEASYPVYAEDRRDD
ncbi:MAG: thiamine pyrophosphate-dependent dehydrogenase E1 component subunit alpha [Anaerolineae bacterium]|nr:MAG: thiamine pyrophosphate-dependent dehydrogenase E1 component subunit alpha [Anaerolineae bacterium]